MLSPGEEFLTVAEIAEALKVNPQTVRNWTDRGSLPAVRVGQRRVRILRSDLERFINQGRTRKSQAQAFWDGDIYTIPRRPRAE